MTDGTAAGTSLLADLNPGTASATPQNFFRMNDGRMLFSAISGTTGRELWVTDGTAAGTSLLFEFVPGTAYGRPENMRATGDGRVLFEAGTTANGREVWITDWTSAGTSMVKDINTVTAAASPSGTTVFRSNDAPALSAALADQTADEDAAFAVSVPAGSFTDANPWDATLSYSATLDGGGALPAWLAFTPGTQAFAGTPANADVGMLAIRVTATDSHGRTASDIFDLEVRNTNDAPAAAAHAIAVTEDATGANLWSTLLGLAADDYLIHGDQLTLSAVGTGGTLGRALFNAATQTLRYVADAAVFDTLASGQTMPDSFTYTVRDLAGATATATV